MQSQKPETENPDHFAVTGVFFVPLFNHSMTQ